MDKGSAGLLGRIRGVLPYHAPGVISSYLSLDTELRRLTVLLGPNASGKTSVLEAIGYALVPLVDDGAALYELTTTLRPRLAGPAPLGLELEPARTGAEAGRVKVVYMNFPVPLLFLRQDKAFEALVSLLGDDERKLLLEAVEADFELASKLGLPMALRERPVTWSPANAATRAIAEFVEEAMGDVSISILSKLPRGVGVVSEGGPTQLEELAWRVLLSPRWLRLIYVLADDRLVRGLVIEGVRGSIFIRQRSGIELGISAAVFHPGFIYRRGAFETLYYHYISAGLPREDEAVEILSRYMEWFKGFELAYRTLHVKTSDGRRVPVYSLSDGQRLAVFLGMLYAAARGPMVFLVDTPEAFVHPDGLPVVADIIARLAGLGNQVVVSTQSIEFLEELLGRAAEHRVIDEAVVEQLRKTPEGGIEAYAKWDAAVALEALEKLGADLRR